MAINKELYTQEIDNTQTILQMCIILDKYVRQLIDGGYDTTGKLQEINTKLINLQNQINSLSTSVDEKIADSNAKITTNENYIKNILDNIMTIMDNINTINTTLIGYKKLDVDTLHTLLEGSNDIIVDVNETNDKLRIDLQQNVKDKLEDIGTTVTTVQPIKINSDGALYLDLGIGGSLKVINGKLYGTGDIVGSEKSLSDTTEYCTSIVDFKEDGNGITAINKRILVPYNLLSLEEQNGSVYYVYNNSAQTETTFAPYKFIRKTGSKTFGNKECLSNIDEGIAYRNGNNIDYNYTNYDIPLPSNESDLTNCIIGKEKDNNINIQLRYDANKLEINSNGELTTKDSGGSQEKTTYIYTILVGLTQHSKTYTVGTFDFISNENLSTFNINTLITFLDNTGAKFLPIKPIIFYKPGSSNIITTPYVIGRLNPTSNIQLFCLDINGNLIQYEYNTLQLNIMSSYQL